MAVNRGWNRAADGTGLGDPPPCRRLINSSEHANRDEGRGAMVRAGTCVRSLPSVVAVAVASSPWTAAAAAAASRHMHAHMDAYVPTYAYTDPNARSVGFLSRASAERRDEGRRNGSVEPTLPRMTQEQGPGSPNLARWLAGAPAWPCPEQKAKDGSGGDGDGGGGGGGGGERGEERGERG